MALCVKYIKVPDFNKIGIFLSGTKYTIVVAFNAGTTQKLGHITYYMRKLHQFVSISEK